MSEFGIQKVPRMRGILNPFSFFDFFRRINPRKRIRHVVPKTAVNAVSTFG